MKIKLFFVRIFFVTVALLPILAGTALAETAKPNILVIWGDDIGTWNISHNNRGMMGYRTPLHGGSGGFHQRLRARSFGHDQSWPARCRTGLAEN
jgi:hypothetical protein